MQGVDREYVMSLLNLLGYVDVHSGKRRFMSRGRELTGFEKWGYDQFVLRPQHGRVAAPIRWAFVYRKKTHITGKSTGGIVFKGRHAGAVKWLQNNPL